MKFVDPEDQKTTPVSGNYGAVVDPLSSQAGHPTTDEPPDEAEHAFLLRRISSPYLSYSEPAYSRNQNGNNTNNIFASIRTVRERIGHLLALPGQECSVRELGGTATIPNEVLNLVKNIVGAGALALPSGVAAFGNAPGVLIPAAVWLIVMGAIFAYYFLLIGRTCKVSRTVSYAEAWEHTYGEVGSGLVALSVALKAGMGNLECSMILADSFRDLFATAGLTVTRSQALSLVTLVALLPLCLLKNLAVLAPFSMLGLAAMLFAAIAMAIRYFDGSYDVATGGAFLEDISQEMQPSFGTVGVIGAVHVQVLVLLCMVSEAYIAHYNAPRFWVELKSKTVPRFGAVVGYSFGISALYYVFVTAFGFLTFGANSSGFILDNYSTNDDLASISRACVGFSLIFTYPIIFIGFRDGMLDVLMVSREFQTDKSLNLLTLILLVIITILAMSLEDLGMVTAVGGGTLGTVVVFVIPTLMFCRAVKKLGPKATALQRREIYLATVLMWVGISMGVFGVYLALTD